MYLVFYVLTASASSENFSWK